MPLYGSIAAAKQLLQATDTDVFEGGEDARLAELQKVVSLLIEQETGRTFGDGPSADETVLAWGPGVSPVLILPKAARSVTSIVSGGSWDGSAYTGGSTMLATAYRLTNLTQSGEALTLTTTGGGYWSGPYAITGQWEDADADAVVPADIDYVANYLMAERFKVENASPSGQIGPDGAVIPIRNALKDPLVKQKLDHYRRSTLTVAV